MAISGTATREEVIDVTSSGNEVASARSIPPIRACPSPVFSAIISPNLDKYVPDIMIRPAIIINLSHR